MFTYSFGCLVKFGRLPVKFGDSLTEVAEFCVARCDATPDWGCQPGWLLRWTNHFCRGQAWHANLRASLPSKNSWWNGTGLRFQPWQSGGRIGQPETEIHRFWWARLSFLAGTHRYRRISLDFKSLSRCSALSNLQTCWFWNEHAGIEFFFVNFFKGNTPAYPRTTKFLDLSWHVWK